MVSSHFFKGTLDESKLITIIGHSNQAQKWIALKIFP